MTTIVLNAEAVALLFPEGSEARLKLAHNVTDILVKSLALKQTKELAEEVQVEVKQISRAALRDLGVASDFRGTTVFGDHIRDAIRKHAQQTVNALMVEGIDAALEKRKELIDLHMGNLDAQIQRRIDALVDAKLKDEVKKVMRTLLAPT